MGLKVKPVAISATKWVENAGRASSTYAIEAAASGEVWASQTAGAQGNYQKAIQAPGIANRFGAGVRAAGASGYTTGINLKGKDRFAQGVNVSKPAYTTKVEPYLATLAALTLSPRAPRGDPANYNRVNEVGKALNARRLAMLGAGA